VRHSELEALHEEARASNEGLRVQLNAVALALGLTATSLGPYLGGQAVGEEGVEHQLLRGAPSASPNRLRLVPLALVGDSSCERGNRRGGGNAGDDGALAAAVSDRLASLQDACGTAEQRTQRASLDLEEAEAKLEEAAAKLGEAEAKLGGAAERTRHDAERLDEAEARAADVQLSTDRALGDVDALSQHLVSSEAELQEARAVILEHRSQMGELSAALSDAHAQLAGAQARSAVHAGELAVALEVAREAVAACDEGRAEVGAALQVGGNGSWVWRWHWVGHGTHWVGHRWVMELIGWVIGGSNMGHGTHGWVMELIDGS
jgi:hypothetical protein